MKESTGSTGPQRIPSKTFKGQLEYINSLEWRWHNPEFLNLSTVDMLSQIHFCCRDCSVPCRLVGSLAGFCHLDASSTPVPSSPATGDNQECVQALTHVFGRESSPWWEWLLESNACLQYLIIFNYLLFWLHWVFVAAPGFSPVADLELGLSSFET